MEAGRDRLLSGGTQEAGGRGRGRSHHGLLWWVGVLNAARMHVRGSKRKPPETRYCLTRRAPVLPAAALPVPER